MRIAEYKQISTRVEQRTVHHDAEYDDAGNITADAYDETVDVEVPVMGLVYRDMTVEEIEEMNKQQEEMPASEKTDAEKITDLQEQNKMLTQCLMEMSEIVYA